MINSGITRRIDDLGRIVVPKELRNNLGIRDGEPLLIHTENDSIIIKKYSKVATLQEQSDKLVNIVSDVLNIKMIITDREKVISKNFVDDDLSTNLDIELKSFIDNRENYYSKELDKFLNLKGFFIVVPIINSSDSIGLVIIYSSKNDIEKHVDLARVISKIIISW